MVGPLEFGADPLCGSEHPTAPGGDPGYEPDGGGGLRKPAGVAGSGGGGGGGAGGRGGVSRRLARLGDAERHVLDAAAVVGTVFGPDVVARVLGEPAATVLRTLNRLSRESGLVHPAG